MYTIPSKLIPLFYKIINNHISQQLKLNNLGQCYKCFSSELINAKKEDLFYFHPSCSEITKQNILNSFKVLPNFINDEEESILVKNIEPHFTRKPYQRSHFDDVRFNS